MKSIKSAVNGGMYSGFVTEPGEDFLRTYLNGFTNLDKAVAHSLREYRVAVLQHLQVDFGKRGAGLGSSLVAQFLLDAGDAGATAFLLVCDEDQLQREGFVLHEWYEALGFGALMDSSSGPLMVAPQALCTAMREEFGFDLSCDPVEDFGP